VVLLYAVPLHLREPARRRRASAQPSFLAATLAPATLYGSLPRCSLDICSAILMGCAIAHAAPATLLRRYLHFRPYSLNWMVLTAPADTGKPGLVCSSALSSRRFHPRGTGGAPIPNRRSLTPQRMTCSARSSASAYTPSSHLRQRLGLYARRLMARHGRDNNPALHWFGSAAQLRRPRLDHCACYRALRPSFRTTFHCCALRNNVKTPRDAAFPYPGLGPYGLPVPQPLYRARYVAFL